MEVNKVVLGTLGMLAAAAGIAEWADKSSKNAYPAMKDHQIKKDFEAECARYGIKGKTNKFTDLQIMKIAAYNNVRVDKYGILPEDGWMKCEAFVQKYSNNIDDLLDFQNAWHTAIAHQLDRKRKVISDPNNKVLRRYPKNNKFFSDPKNDHKWKKKTIVLELHHWHGIPVDQQLQRMNELQTETYWGRLCKEPPILRENPNVPGTYIETWILYASAGHTQGSRYTEGIFKDWYKECCAKIGYDAML